MRPLPFIAQRWQITRGRVRVQNELHSLLHRHNIVAPAGQGTLFRAVCRPFWEALDVSLTGKLQIQHVLAQLDLFNQQLEQIDAEIARLSRTPAWEPQVRLLPGFGALTAMTILGAIGDIGRFECAKKLVGYAGLGAGIRASGNKMAIWYWRLPKAHKEGFSRTQFVRWLLAVTERATSALDSPCAH